MRGTDIRDSHTRGQTICLRCLPMWLVRRYLYQGRWQYNVRPWDCVPQITWQSEDAQQVHLTLDSMSLRPDRLFKHRHLHSYLWCKHSGQSMSPTVHSPYNRKRTRCETVPRPFMALKRDLLLDFRHHPNAIFSNIASFAHKAAGGDDWLKEIFIMRHHVFF